MNYAMEERNDIVIYNSEDGLVKMEALVDPAGETIWATQKAIAALFGVTVPNISYHLGRIFRSGELEPDAVVKEILITAQSGARGLSDDKVRYYNLDAIISIGYKVNSVRATKFRIWAANVIKQYMLKGYAVNRNAVSEQKYEDLKNRNSRVLCNHLTPFSKISAPKHVFFASGYCFSQIIWLYL